MVAGLCQQPQAVTPPDQTTLAERLPALRGALGALGLHACLIPSSDPHLSEYLPERWQGRQWLSGFTGSSGTLLVAGTQAALFTDSRYWEQADAELVGSGIDLVKLDGAALPAYLKWLDSLNLSEGDKTLGLDGNVMGLAQTQALSDALTAKGWQLNTSVDVFDRIWPDRPGLPDALLYEHLQPHAATARADKLSQIREAMKAAGATHHWIATLDDLAWALNLRGSDVDYNPVFLGHALIGLDTCQLFVAMGKVSSGLHRRLKEDGIEVRPYETALNALASLTTGATLLVDPKRITWGLRRAVPEGVKVMEAINPSTLAKSRKTDAEAAFVRQAMEHDGAAMCEFYAWFEQALGREYISELTIDERLSAEREKQPGFVSLSFPTIAGFNANGAQPHYRATRKSHAVISNRDGRVTEGLLLIDSGAQYLGGTTDITRVWAIGTPSTEQKRDYTLVLKGTMALSRTRFPQGTPGPMLDAIARAPLWAHGIDFGHGTGHGVGYFLNVHEGPQSISKAVPDANMAMLPGMITSIEPGLYRPRQWGIRIENLVLTVPVPSSVPDAEPGAPEFGQYLRFETLTLCPIDTRCIDLALLSVEEIDWLNGYHAEVQRRLKPLLEGDSLAWLNTRTQPISR
jgi:Xaa-Pro aminopeptidase